LNQAEIETLARQFRSAGHEIVPSADEADLAVVNTCTVTAEAASDSRAAIRRAKRLGVNAIIATGCWATLEPAQAASLEGVSRIVPNERKDSLAADLFGLPQEFFDLEPLARLPLPGLHARTRLFIKAQDGCDNACTFCLTTIARGPSRSRPVETILKDVKSAIDGGVQEVVLTGVHLGAWGRDLPLPRRLADLAAEVLARTSIPRLRLSSLEPWDLDRDFFSLWADPRLCRHLHLPLQSGSAAVLHRMRRKTTPGSFSALIEAARSAIPEVAITTDIMVGFPGETEAEFNETLDLVKTLQFAGGHIFSYSRRPGTPAVKMKGQIPGQTARVRGVRLHALLAESGAAYRSTFIGRTLPVLWESTSQLSDVGWQMEGLTDNYIRVKATAPRPRWNMIDEVLLTGETGDGLAGEIVSA
jgi:threonylcarbamoyladenosine tRNA methylthiotransferase MtaB